MSETCGPPETLVLRDMPEPVPGPGEVRIAVEACGINYPDVLMIEDRYQFTQDRPFAPGIEICGRVEVLGAGVTGMAAGTRVVAQVRSGGLAEKVVVAADRLITVGEAIPAPAAASILLTYGTSYYALRDRAALRAGEMLLVLGAGGGVGLAAVQLGKRMGATVVAAASSQEKCDLALAAGADRAITYDATVDRQALAARFKQACPGGADVIYDPVGGDYAEPAFRAIGWEGRYLAVGFAAGIPHLPLNLVLLKSAQIVGVFWGAAIERAPGPMLAAVEEVYGWVADGSLKPLPPTVYPLAAGGAAIAALRDRRAAGKLVVSIG